MIAALVKGRGFGGCVSYLFNGRRGEERVHERGAMVYSNMAGNTPKELAWEFRRIAALRPQLKKSVFHASLSLAPEDRTLNEADWSAITQRFMNEMGFAECPVMAYRHSPTSDGSNLDHIHIVASRVDTAGNAISDQQDFRRAEKALRRIEADFRLRAVQSSPHKNNKMEAKTMNGNTAAAEATLPNPSAMSVECGEPNLTDKKRRNLKRQLLEDAYSKTIAACLLGCVRYVERRPNELRVHTNDNGLLLDRGDSITATGMAPKDAAQRLVLMCIAKNWKSVVLRGDDAFLREAMAAALREGLKVSPLDSHQLAIWNELTQPSVATNQSTMTESPESTNPALPENLTGVAGFGNRLNIKRNGNIPPLPANPRFPPWKL